MVFVQLPVPEFSQEGQARIPSCAGAFFLGALRSDVHIQGMISIGILRC